MNTEPRSATPRGMDARTLEAFGQHVPGALYVFQRFADGTTRLNYVTAGIAAIYGCTPEELYADLERGHRHIHPADRQAFDASIVASFAALEPWTHEYRVVLPDAGTRYISAAASPEPQTDGSVLWFGHLIDVTAFKRAEQHANATARRYQQLVEAIGDGAWFHDVATGTLTFSEGWWRMLGHDPGAIESTIEAWYRVVHPQDLPAAAAALAALIAGEVPSIAFEHRVRTRNAGQKWILGRGVVTETDAHGHPAMVAGTYMDITARKEAEHRLRLQAQVIEAAPLGIFVADTSVADCPLRYVNAAFCAAYGISRETASGRPWGFLDDACDAETLAVELRDLLLAGRPAQRLLRFSGERWRKLSLTPIDTGGGHARVIGIVEDVTEERRMRQALIDARETAIAANEAKSRFLAHVSHELRTPLHAVMGLAELLADDLGLPVAGRDNAREIHRAAEHLLKVIGDIIDCSAIEADRVALSIEHLDAATLVADVVQLAQPLARKAGVTVRVDAALRGDAVLQCDGRRTRQVLLNLVANAIKYNRPDGSVTLKALPAANGCLRIGVIDTGLGLDASAIERLFEPFDRLGRECSDLEGSGIGLLIARGLTAAMGGTLGVESAPGLGSTFWVELPRGAQRMVTALGMTLGSSLPAPTAPEGGDLRVLVADDNALSRAVFAQQLTRLGYQPYVVSDGGQAWDTWQRDQHAIVITDLHMPGIDGSELARRIRHHETREPWRRTWIICASANTMNDLERAAPTLDMDARLTKPVTLTALHDALAAAPLAGAGGAGKDEDASGAPSAFPAAPRSSIDLTVLEALVGDDPHSMKTFIEQFRISAAVDVEAMLGALAACDLRAVETSAHRLKTTARTVGAARLADLCESLERRAARDDPIDSLSACQAIRAEHAAVRRAISASRQGRLIDTDRAALPGPHPLTGPAHRA